MNIEIERKYKINDFDAIKAKIEEMGAKQESIKTTNDRYFEVPQRVARTKYLRIRFNDKSENGTLAYHEVIDDLQTKEWEIDVDVAETAQQILEKIGFQPEVDVKKERIKYKFGEIEILLDKVDNLGSFIEIEAPGLEQLTKISQEIGVDKKDIISGAGYPDLIKEKNETST